MVAVVVLKPGQVVDAVLRTWLIAARSLHVVVAIDEDAGVSKVVATCKAVAATVLVADSTADERGIYHAELPDVQLLKVMRNDTGAVYGAMVG